MNYEQLETDIVNRLAPLVPVGVAVVKLPETEDELRKPFQSGRITVCYKGSRFHEPANPSTGMLRSTAQIVQNELPAVEVVIQSRFLRTNNFSAYKLLAIVKRALIGFQPTHCNRMYGKETTLVVNDQEPADLFTFVASFECSTLVVEEYDAAVEDGANITQITLDDEIHGDVVVP